VEAGQADLKVGLYINTSELRVQAGARRGAAERFRDVRRRFLAY
jgi:hypothetical protein